MKEATMGQSAPDRHLAAILTADVVGYSRLVGSDEIGTLRKFKTILKGVIEPSVARHRGHIVKTMGDGLLAEFPSAVEAVSCALIIQQRNTREAIKGPEDQRIVLRIGINLGDIIVDGNDIFGDGVNVAARLETLCQPGGLCISRAVRDQVRDKLPLHFEDMGEHTVKNMARPIRVFSMTPEVIAVAPDLSSFEHPFPPARRTSVLVTGLVLVVGLAGATTWWAVEWKPWSAGRTGATDSNSRSAALPGATLAVLPLTMLGESSGDYFADALTED